ncbi:putative F-box protein At1g33530 [Neltuma alba]|uniref:putative F-box protein At1g33530 n=1 Tax=Neltuma alba TaxID=207710 RepID=UPI0010A2C490|nr:putative F-box protein At1g33530 [Prosopis alba]
MKQRIAGGDTAAPYLHEEIIRQILKRLPVKSLIRFQCVSERWKNLIKSPSFIDEHLHYSTHQNPSLLLRKSNGRFKPLQLRLMDSEMHVREVQNPPLPLRSLLTFSIVGSCNGLVCAEIDGMINLPPPHPFCCGILLLGMLEKSLQPEALNILMSRFTSDLGSVRLLTIIK